MRTLKIFAFTLLFAVSTLARAAAPDIYPAPQHAKPDIARALRTAGAEHKRVILDFGGNWCGDCKVLDIYLHDQQNKPILDANFVVVHINVGQYDANLDLAAKYEIPLKKGVPALAVLNSSGKLLYSQRGGEFEAMRNLQSSALTQFLIQWRPQKPGCSITAVHC